MMSSNSSEEGATSRTVGEQGGNNPSQSTKRKQEDSKKRSQSEISVSMPNDQDMHFPWKLHKMLEDVQRAGKESVVSWTGCGRGFMVHQRVPFVDSIIPFYFNHTKFKSFQRQLYLYGFSRVSEGKDKGKIHCGFIRRIGRLVVSKVCKSLWLQIR